MAQRRAPLKTLLVLASTASLSATPLVATATTASTSPVPTTLLAAPADVSDGVTHEENDRVTPGASWTEHYFPSSDGSDVELHADVLRPAHLPADAETPVILSIGPYFAHAGDTGVKGYDQTGPSPRFYDLVEGADLMERGYTFVMVDVRGYGGSTGCLDWAGPGERADVVASVDWITSQDWSNGKVGMYGKSYDGVTGLLGAIEQPEGLEAVVSQEPLWDMYNYLYSNGVPRINRTGTPSAYNGIATIPPMADDTDRYKYNATYEQRNRDCLINNSANGMIADPQDPYWLERDLATLVTGSDVPLFVAQGMLEPNTKPEDFQEFLENHDGPQRGWLGPWEHVRGNDTNAAGQLLMGREGWFDEVMSFYDNHLLGIEPTVDYPRFAIQDNFGQWRAQDTWPVVNTTTTVNLAESSYLDDGGGTGLNFEENIEVAPRDMESIPTLPEQAKGKAKGLSKGKGKGRDRQQFTFDDDGYYTWSQPVKRDTRITGTPSISFTADNPGNILVRFYDVAPDGSAVMFDEQVSLVKPGTNSFTLKDTDWTLKAGHQLVVRTGTDNSFYYWWLDTPSRQVISLTDPQLTLELQNTRWDVPTYGGRAPFLDMYLEAYGTTVEEKLNGTFRLNVSNGKGR